jgi:hypothetical protein
MRTSVRLRPDERELDAAARPVDHGDGDVDPAGRDGIRSLQIRVKSTDARRAPGAPARDGAGTGAPASDRAGVWGGAPRERRGVDGHVRSFGFVDGGKNP